METMRAKAVENMGNCEPLQISEFNRGIILLQHAGISTHFVLQRIFGARGAEEDGDRATIFNVKLDRVIEGKNPVRLNVPLVLPAIIKLNWRDYFSAAAMAGTVCVIGEGSPSKDPHVEYRNGKMIFNTGSGLPLPNGFIFAKFSTNSSLISEKSSISTSARGSKYRSWFVSCSES